MFLSFLVINIFVPEKIKTSKNINSYLESLLSKQSTLNIIDEFSFLDRISEDEKVKYNLKAYLPVSDNGARVLSKEQAIRRFGEVKFAILDESKWLSRFLGALLFIMGIIAVYARLVIASIYILFNKDYSYLINC